MIGFNSRYDNKKHSQLVPLRQKELKISLILSRKLLVPVMFVSMFFTATLQAAPASPSGVRIEVYLDSTIEIFWDRADRNAHVSGYELNRNGTRLWLGADTSYVDDEFSPGITNNYTVVAVDENGARSADSRVVSVSDSCSNSSGGCTSFSFAESKSSDGIRESGIDVIEDVTLPTYSNNASESIRQTNDTAASSIASRKRGNDRLSSFDASRSSGYVHTYKIFAIDVGGNQLGDVMITDKGLGGDRRSRNARSEGAAKYDVYRDGHWIARTKGRRFHDAGLNQNTHYEYTVYKIEDGTSHILGSATIATED